MDRAPAARYVSLCSTWSRSTGRVKTTAAQIDGLHVPPSTCCVHTVAASSQALSEEALLKVKKQHERGLERGSGKCLRNIRNDMEETFRSRPLPLVLRAGAEATEDERGAVDLAAAFVSGKTVQDLSSSDVIEELNRHLPGKWLLSDSGAEVRESTWRLRDSLSVAPWTADRIPLTAELRLPSATRFDNSNGRLKDLQQTKLKVETRWKRTRGTPEAENAARVLVDLRKKLKILEQQQTPPM